MKIKTIIIIAISVVIILALIILALLHFTLLSHITNIKDMLSFLKLPITEEQIIKKEIRAQPSSTTLLLYVDHNTKFENSALFDIALYEGSSVYDDLATLIKEHDMSIDETEIRLYHVQYSIKDGLFSALVFANEVYIIKGNSNYTLIYTNIPKGVKLPRDYRPE